MGMNSSYISAVIFANTQKEANNFLLKLIEDEGLIISELKMRPKVEALTIDGRKYVATCANESVRGRRYEKAYVQKNVPKEYIYSRVMAGFSGDTDLEYFE